MQYVDCSRVNHMITVDGSAIGKLGARQHPMAKLMADGSTDCAG